MAEEISKSLETPIIEFSGVSKTYLTGTHALNDVNIDIKVYYL